MTTHSIVTHRGAYSDNDAVTKLRVNKTRKLEL